MLMTAATRSLSPLYFSTDPSLPRQLSADEFNQMMYSRGVKREVDMKRLEDQVRQSFKVSLFVSHLP